VIQRGAIGRDRLLKTRRPALTLFERGERIAEIVLRRRPVERNALLRPFLQRGAMGRDRLLKTRRPALTLPEIQERIAEIVLRHRPVERNAIPRPLLQRGAIAATASSRRVLLSPSADRTAPSSARGAKHLR
jgi:hypothetical protein